MNIVSVAQIPHRPLFLGSPYRPLNPHSATRGLIQFIFSPPARQLERPRFSFNYCCRAAGLKMLCIMLSTTLLLCSRVLF